jgi:hypothetical protein
MEGIRLGFNTTDLFSINCVDKIIRVVIFSRKNKCAYLQQRPGWKVTSALGFEAIILVFSTQKVAEVRVGLVPSIYHGPSIAWIRFTLVAKKGSRKCAGWRQQREQGPSFH